MTGTTLLQAHQRLATSAARGAMPFTIAGTVYLAIPQHAADVPGKPAAMNGGDSDIPTLVYRWSGGAFEEFQQLAVPAGEDAEFFRIGGEAFLATASIRTGSGPYDLNATSIIFRWDGTRWQPWQDIASFAAKQWRYFTFDGRHFLALAQGLPAEGVEARHPRQSCIFEWDGERFASFQAVDTRAGYNWHFFEAAGQRFLAYADHGLPSRLYRWDGRAFVPFQEFSAQGGRAFQFFEKDGAAWLAYAEILGESTLYRWDGARFQPYQPLGGPGGREFALFEHEGHLHLVRIRFILGTPAAPKSDLTSEIYRWEQGGFVLAQEFRTHGGTDAATFTADGRMYLAVANSLTPEIRFREDTVIYRLGS